jgi:flagellar motility protein MotE (MotC chaperone)
MKQFLSMTGIAVVLAVTCVSCDKLKSPQPELQPPPATSGQANPQQGEHAAFAQAAQKELDELRSAIAEFRAKAATANAQTKAKLGEDVEKLESDLRDTQQRLTELKSATVESWNQVKDAFGNSLEKLKNGIDSFRKNTA